jgi:hypothetical protein
MAFPTRFNKCPPRVIQSRQTILTSPQAHVYYVVLSFLPSPSVAPYIPRECHYRHFAPAMCATPVSIAAIAMPWRGRMSRQDPHVATHDRRQTHPFEQSRKCCSRETAMSRILNRVLVFVPRVPTTSQHSPWSFPPSRTFQCAFVIQPRGMLRPR